MYFILLILTLINFQILEAQEKEIVILEGQQIVINNKQNVKLISDEVILPQKYQIIKVETNSDGFWIQSDNKIVKSFSKKDNVFVPDPLNFVLDAGKYKAFPNLNKNSKNSFVKIYLKPLK